MTLDILFSAFVYLAAAVIAVPIARRVGLGSVLGYLIAGTIIGPHALKLVGQDDEHVMHVAEFGVVLMLFLVGLELQPSRLWRLRASIFGLGTIQLAGTAFAIALVGVLFGHAFKVGLAAGLILAMSSTAVALQLLGEKGHLKSPGGQAAFSVLLFQDLAIIPILAILPLLALSRHAQIDPAHSSPIAHLQPWQQAMAVVLAVGGLFVGGRYLLRPVFRYIAGTRLREVFTAATLLLVIGTTMLMQMVGLSPALGTFLAGVLLADSEYRHQLEADIEPFKGLLLGLFFISVGAGIDFGLIQSQPIVVFGLTIGFVVLKLAVMYGIARAFRLDNEASLLVAFALAQGGEFGFVLIATSVSGGALPREIAGILTAAIALSMALAPLLLTVFELLIRPRLIPRSSDVPHEEIPDEHPVVILAGFGRFGNVVGRLIRAAGFPTTVLDSDPEQVETLRKFGLRSFYGDASRIDLLESAGAAQARILIVAVDDEASTMDIIEKARRRFPQLQIIVRAMDRAHASDLLRAGIERVERETFGSALDLGVQALRALGVRGNQAFRMAQMFRCHDEKSVRELAFMESGKPDYISRARQHIQNLEQILGGKSGIEPEIARAWHPLRPDERDESVDR